MSQKITNLMRRILYIGDYLLYFIASLQIMVNVLIQDTNKSKRQKGYVCFNFNKQLYK